MNVEWVVLTDSGVSHAFLDEGEPLAKTKSLCGLKPPRQLVLPYNLPEPPTNTHCVRCGWSVKKRSEKSDGD